MATPSFSKRLSIWWAATRLLLGGKQDHISLQHSISQPAIDFRDVQRFGHLRHADRSDCDPRLWGVALRGPDPSDTPKLATRLGLILSVWDSMDQKARNEAFISFRRRHALLPEDPVLQAVDVFLSTDAGGRIWPDRRTSAIPASPWLLGLRHR